MFFGGFVVDAEAFRTLLPDLARAPSGAAALRLVDDGALAWGTGSEPDVLVGTWSNAGQDRVAWLAANAEELLAAYYRTHPLTRAGFDRQARELLQRHGASAFAGIAGELPERSLFVDVGSVVAEPRGAPRHRYGVYCALDRRPGDVDLAVRRWLDRGEAYDGYLGMNVCRYNC